MLFIQIVLSHFQLRGKREKYPNPLSLCVHRALSFNLDLISDLKLNEATEDLKTIDNTHSRINECLFALGYPPFCF